MVATRAQPVPIAPALMTHNKQTNMPNTETHLGCTNRRRLAQAVKQAETRFVADWLLSSSQHAFHHRPAISTTLFEKAIAVRATLKTAPPSPGPGSDHLLVPVSVQHGKLLGYSFGGLSKEPSEEMCPYGGPSHPIFPHFVGRFSFDIASGDFLMIIPKHVKNVMGVLHMRPNGDDREKSLFVVEAGNYDYQRLPERLMSMITVNEKRKKSSPKFQYSLGGRSSDHGLNDALAKMERVLKGTFTSPNMRKDDMELGSGEIVMRRTMPMEEKFEAMDAVGLQRARDQAMRIYFGYMSSVSGGGPSKQRQ